MNIVKFWSVFSFVKIVSAEVYTNENGVTFEYSINFKSRCRSEEGRFAFKQGLSIAQCVEECGLRPDCAAFNYRRRAQVCELFSEAKEGVNRIVDCTFMDASNINVLQNPCGVCEDGRVCETSSHTCIYRECQTAIAPENGKILGNRNEIGGQIKYSCDYVGMGEAVNAICLSNGQWSATANCSKDCGGLPTIAHGTVVQDSIQLDRAILNCATGFQGSDSTINCTANGNWENATCDRISCGNPASVVNGNIAVDTGTMYQDTATVTCDAGYQASVNTISCTASGSWEAVTCDPISCGNPASVINGDIAVDAGTMYQDTATVTCDAGYQASVNTISCMASGSWNTVTCDSISCGTPASVVNGDIAVDAGTMYQDTATVTCDAGHQASVNTISCTLSGSWDTATCDPISCGNPASIANGNIALNSGTVYMDTASINCNTNFVASSSTIQCTALGSWETATCVPPDCYISNVWDYAGTRNVTPTGYPCARWVDHSGDGRVDVQYMPESSLSEAQNYCRQPSSNNWNIWCFTTNPNLSNDYELCGISQC